MLLVPLPLLLRPHVELDAASVGEYLGSFSSRDLNLKRRTVKEKESRIWKGERAASTLVLDVWLDPT